MMPTIEGLWSLTMEQAPETGAEDVAAGGIVVLETNRIFGGDSLLYYVGGHSVKDRRVKGVVRVVNYGGPEPALTVFGDYVRDREVGFDLLWDGDERMSGKIWRVEAPEIKLAVELTKRADLPSP